MEKRQRTTKELQKIAADLRTGWVQGDPVAPFLRRSLTSIDKLVHEELVSLRDIATALGLAGITFKTGHAWSADNLRKELGKARAKLKQANPDGRSGKQQQGPQPNAVRIRRDSKMGHEQHRPPIPAPPEKKQTRRLAVTPVATPPPSAAHVPIPAATAPAANPRPTSAVAPGAQHVSDLERKVQLLQSSPRKLTEAEREEALTAVLGKNWRESLRPVPLARSRRPGSVDTE
jgi:hypothetical protein